MARNQTPPAFDLDAMHAHAGEATRLLKALANEKRLQVLCLLAGGERSVGELQGLLDLGQSALSQHLARMRDEKLVTFRRESQVLWYRIADPRIEQLLSTLQTLFCPPPKRRARR